MYRYMLLFCKNKVSNAVHVSLLKHYPVITIFMLHTNKMGGGLHTLVSYNVPV